MSTASDGCVTITFAELVDGPAGSLYMSVPETVAVSVLVRLPGEVSERSVTVTVVVAPGASGPASVQLAVPLPLDVGTAVAPQNVKTDASHVSVSGMVVSVVSPELVTARSNTAVSPGWICASCPMARVLRTVTFGTVMRMDAVAVASAGLSPYWSMALATFAVSVVV